MSVNNDFRQAAGLGRWPVSPGEPEPDDSPAPLRGPGLFEVVRGSGERVITNVRRLAGAERAPGSRLVLAATILLGLLAAGLFVVTLNAQYKYVWTVKQQSVPSMIEAASLDLGMAIFTLLALGLAMAGQSARIERALIVACALGSAAQNYAAADVTSPRSVAAYVAPSLFLALVVDRVVAVVRRHVLGAAEGSVWVTVGRSAAVLTKGLGLVLLYLLRFLLAPPSTGAGLRRVVLNAAPLPTAPERPPLPAAEEVPAIEPPEITEPPELEGASKKARLAWWYERDEAYGDRKRTAEAAKRLAPNVDLSEGTARAYIGAILDGLGRAGMSTAVHIIGALLRFLFAVIGALAQFAIHHRLTALVVLVAIAAAVLFYRRMLSRSAQVRRRTRALRWRARLRLRPGPGFASLAELWLRWGRLAAVRHGGRARPGLPLAARFFGPVTRCAVRLGRAQYGRRCLARMEDQQLVLAPQRTGKSGIIADRLLDHPGPAIVTSTRTDLYQLTAGARSQAGPLFVWNPQNVGGLPSTFGFDLLAPCRDLVMARRMAGWLTGAIASENANHGNLEWFEKKGDAAAMALLHAAALGGYTISDVYRWVQLDGHENALRVLAGQRGSELLVALLKRMFAENKTAGSVRETIDLSLSWAVIPGLADAVTPACGEGFDLAEFIAGNGTLFLIASGDEDSPVAPLFRAFTSWVHWQAGQFGSTAAAGRLDPPLWLGLDEVTTICPVDLPVMLSDSAGKGVLITAVAHGTSQLEERWGPAGAKTVWACCGTKVILGGISDAGTLEEVSELCGTIVIGEDDSKTVRIVPPELIRALPDWRALVLRMNLSPVIVKFRPAWKRLGYRLGRRVPVYIPRQHAAQLPAREPVPAELEPALSEADLAKFFDEDAPRADPAPSAFPLPPGPDPRAFKRGEPSS